MLLILGDRERIYSAEAAAVAARTLLPSIKVEIVPDAHHITAIAQPELVSARAAAVPRRGTGRQTEGAAGPQGRRAASPVAA